MTHVLKDMHLHLLTAAGAHLARIKSLALTHSCCACSGGMCLYLSCVVLTAGTAAASAAGTAAASAAASAAGTGTAHSILSLHIVAGHVPIRCYILLSTCSKHVTAIDVTMHEGTHPLYASL